MGCVPCWAQALCLGEGCSNGESLCVVELRAHSFIKWCLTADEGFADGVSRGVKHSGVCLQPGFPHPFLWVPSHNRRNCGMKAGGAALGAKAVMDGWTS